MKQPMNGMQGFPNHRGVLSEGVDHKARKHFTRLELSQVTEQILGLAKFNKGNASVKAADCMAGGWKRFKLVEQNKWKIPTGAGTAWQEGNVRMNRSCAMNGWALCWSDEIAASWTGGIKRVVLSQQTANSKVWVEGTWNKPQKGTGLRWAHINAEIKWFPNQQSWLHSRKLKVLPKSIPYSLFCEILLDTILDTIFTLLFLSI